ncbi:Guanosine-diphosphatase [Dinochytrium kinnereticum]|nr:Guanosine-diphosphatase [Dinochytrium kinnereticum]
MASPKSRRRGSNAGIAGPYERLPTTAAYQPASANLSYVYPVRRIVGCLGIFALCTFLLFAFVIPNPSLKGQGEVSPQKANPKPNIAVGPNSTKKKATTIAKVPTTFHTKPPCEKPLTPGRPLLQHAIMIDAGSTGSRIHVYRFHFCDGPQPTLLGEIFHQLKPGLSSFADDPEGAAASLDKLMEKAEEAIDEEMRGCTPVAVKATAGLRLIGEKKSKDILAAVRNRLENKYKFQVISGDDGVGVMDGRDEGVYAWITVNYLLKRITSKDRKPTAAIMDLGGGSTQIVFEPLNADPPLAPGDHRYDLKFNGRSYVLYQHSYLGYGLMEGRKSLLKAAVTKSATKQKSSTDPILPCLPHGYAMNVSLPRSAFQTVQDEEKKEVVEVTVKGSGSGFAACSQYVSAHLFDKDPSRCSVDPCSWDGVHQPPMAVAFPEPDGDIYAFSYIYDRTVELGYFVDGNGDPTPFSVDGIRDVGDQICAVGLDGKPHGGRKGAAKGVDGRPGLAVKNEPAVCMDLGFIYHLLATGYEIRGGREIKTAKKIDGVETGWCLGAAIRVLDEMTSEGLAGGLCKA